MRTAQNKVGHLQGDSCSLEHLVEVRLCILGVSLGVWVLGQNKDDLVFTDIAALDEQSDNPSVRKGKERPMPPLRPHKTSSIFKEHSRNRRFV